MNRVRLEECERNTKFMPSEMRLKIFLKKYKIRALKFIVLLLNCTLGPPNLGAGGGPGTPGPPPLDLLVKINRLGFAELKTRKISKPTRSYFQK